MRVLIPLLLMAAFAAADTNTTALAEKLRQRKIDRFFKAVEADDGLDGADAQPQVVVLAGGQGLVEAANLIEQRPVEQGRRW